MQEKKDQGRRLDSVAMAWAKKPPIEALWLTTKPPANDSLIKNIKEYNIKLTFADLSV